MTLRGHPAATQQRPEDSSIREAPPPRPPITCTTWPPAAAPTSPTGINLTAGRGARLALGPTRDVVIIDGDVATLDIDALPAEPGDRFTTHTGFDPRTQTTQYHWYRITPRRIQAWREADELPGRDLMRDGRWLQDELA